MVTDLSGQTLEFGVDTTVPAIDDIDGDMRYTAAPSAFSFDAFDDEGVASGDNLHSVPLMVRTQKRDALAASASPSPTMVPCPPTLMTETAPRPLT